MQCEVLITPAGCPAYSGRISQQLAGLFVVVGVYVVVGVTVVVGV
jgi:hypothetical protein